MSDNPLPRRRPRAYDGRRSAEIAVFDATEELLGEQSLQDLTVARIVERAALSRANFYHYFASKYDVVVALVGRVLDQTYTDDGPWQTTPGKSRARSMDASLRETLAMWSSHGPIICAAIENMHVVPELGAAWQAVAAQFVDAVTEQIIHERELGTAPDGPPADMVASMLVCAIERVFYVGTRQFDPRLPTADAVVDAVVAVTFAAIYRGSRPYSHKTKATRNEPLPKLALAGSRQPPNHPANDTAATILRGLNDVLTERSLESATVEDVLERAGASRATFYFYYGSKEDAFIALFAEVAAGFLEGISQLLDIDRTDPHQVRRVISEWLDIDPQTAAVVRNAIHEWPRRPDLRRGYLETMTRMTDVLHRVIATDRKAGIALDGPPSAQTAAVLMWTIERTVAGALAEEEHLKNPDEVAMMLADLVVNTVYGR